MRQLKGQAAVITGAASGLGRELALTLAQQGCCLYLVDRDLAGLLEVQLQQPANIVRLFECDLGDPAERLQLIRALTAEAPRLSLLINCAGIGSHSSLEQLSLAEVTQVMQVNTLAPLELMAGLAPMLACRPAGCVVNIGSTAGEAALPSMGLYCASKAALHAFSRAANLEAGSMGVSTLLVVLGSLRDTRFSRSIRNSSGVQSQWFRRLDARPREAARAIVAAIERGQHLLIYPTWYRPVLWATKVFAPLAALITQAGYRRLRRAAQPRAEAKDTATAMPDLGR